MGRKEHIMDKWTAELVADRFSEAAQTADRLPPVRIQGYFNCWPDIQRMAWENLGAEPRVYRFPPEPAAIDRMHETMRWVQWLEEEQRHLIWMRAKRYEWQKIAKRFGYCTRTAQRRWQRALQSLADHLNDISVDTKYF
ncbi:MULTISPECIES: DUF6362 family protein [Nitrosomonas]|nr:MULTISPECIES: DUF6362 family protein [Nitrosomonas]UVS62824.1 DUF6362 family protein [Nitrosomonas sp. PLL12]